MEEINAIFEEAEDLSCMTFTEGCLGCLTGYTIHYCFKTHYERVRVAAGDALIVAPHWAILYFCSRWNELSDTFRSRIMMCMSSEGSSLVTPWIEDSDVYPELILRIKHNGDPAFVRLYLFSLVGQLLHEGRVWSNLHS